MVFQTPYLSVLAATLISTCIAISAANAQGTGAQAGVAAAVRGDVTLIATATSQPDRVVGENLGSGDQIFLGDNIETGPNSGMQIMLLDETIFTIGPDAGMVIDEFVYDPNTSTGQVTASVVKGAFRFVSGRVAKKTPQNMSVRTPVGTIGIRGTSAAGIVTPPDASGNQTGSFILLGPGVDNNADERAGRITVSNGGTSVEITRSGFGTTITGLNGIPIPPIQFAPAVVAALTGGLGTNGGARPSSNSDGQGQSGSDNSGGSGGTPGNTGGSTGGGTGGGTGGQASALSGQNLGVGVAGASVIDQFSGTQDQADQLQEEVAQEAIQVATDTITTFDELRTIQTGTATFDMAGIQLTHSSGPNTNSGGSFDANFSINFGSQTMNVGINSVSYFFAGGPNRSFIFANNESYANKSGAATRSANSTDNPGFFPSAPNPADKVTVTAVLSNDVVNGDIAAAVAAAVSIDNGTDVISGGADIDAVAGGGNQ